MVRNGGCLQKDMVTGLHRPLITKEAKLAGKISVGSPSLAPRPTKRISKKNIK